MRPTFDERDQKMLDERMKEYDAIPGPRVGDYVRMLDGTLRRFTHDWGDRIQTTYLWRSEENQRTFGTRADGGSFYLYGSSVSFSGSLDDSIPKTGLVQVENETMQGAFWFFHHNDACADNGVYFNIPVRVWQQIPVKAYRITYVHGNERYEGKAYGSHMEEALQSFKDGRPYTTGHCIYNPEHEEGTSCI